MFFLGMMVRLRGRKQLSCKSKSMCRKSQKHWIEWHQVKRKRRSLSAWRCAMRRSKSKGSLKKKR